MGYSVLYLTRAKREQNFLLTFLEIAAVGLGTFSFIGVVLQLLHIPLHVSIYLLLAGIVPIWSLFQSIKKKETDIVFDFGQETIYAGILLFILIAFFIFFHSGANAYPYLENDDPWNHAQAATYIAREHTYTVDPEVRELNGGYAFYLEPYPPSYDIIMGLMRQMNDSIVWTLKFFNVLLITLGLAFCYLCARAYLNSDLKALFATIILACLPSFMSHFIWSQTIALVVFPVALYATLKALDDATWRIPAIIMIASELVTQPVISFVFGLVVLGLVALVFMHELLQRKKSKRLADRFPQTINGFIVGAAGVALSFVFWGAQLFKWGISGFIKLRGGELTSGWGGSYALQKYSIWNDAINAPMASRIDQATGWGFIVSLCVIAAIVAIILTSRRTLNIKRGWLHIHLLVWFLILLYAVFAPTFDLPGWASSRSWAYLAIPLAFLATEGVFILLNSITRHRIAQLCVLIVLVTGIALTSLPAKIEVQTAQWPPGANWLAPQAEVPGYLQMQQTLPRNTRVYPFCGGDHRAIGFDMQSDPWDADVSRFRAYGANATGESIIAFLQRHNYEYITMDATCVRDFGEAGTQALAERLTATGRLQPIISQGGFLLAQVR